MSKKEIEKKFLNNVTYMAKKVNLMVIFKKNFFILIKILIILIKLFKWKIMIVLSSIQNDPQIH